jgi:hypothetical protein
MAIADRILPPFGLWCLIALLWYLGTVLVASFHKTRLPGVPGFVPGFLWVVVCIVVGAGVTGPLIFLPLFLVAVWGFVQSLFGLEKAEQARLRRGLNGLGYVAAATVLVTACVSLSLRQQRTTADFIVRWQRSGAAMVEVEKLAKSNTPRDREQLQFVAAHTTGAIAEKAEEALARR